MRFFQGYRGQHWRESGLLSSPSQRYAVTTCEHALGGESESYRFSLTQRSVLRVVTRACDQEPAQKKERAKEGGRSFHQPRPRT